MKATFVHKGPPRICLPTLPSNSTFIGQHPLRRDRRALEGRDTHAAGNTVCLFDVGIGENRCGWVHRRRPLVPKGGLVRISVAFGNWVWALLRHGVAENGCLMPRGSDSRPWSMRFHEGETVGIPGPVPCRSRTFAAPVLALLGFRPPVRACRVLRINRSAAMRNPPVPAGWILDDVLEGGLHHVDHGVDQRVLA